MFFLIQTLIKDNRILKYNLQNIYGIGKYRAEKAIIINGLIQPIKSIELRKSIRSLLKKRFKSFRVTLARRLKQKHKKQYNTILELQAYKGLRHKLGYPARGQRTRTNAKTQKLLTRKKNLIIQPIKIKKVEKPFLKKVQQNKKLKSKAKPSQTQKKKSC